jgi:hypothetical protein
MLERKCSRGTWHKPNEERETAELLKNLQPRKEKVPLKSLLKGEFPSKPDLPLPEKICLSLVNVDVCKKKKILPKIINTMSHSSASRHLSSLTYSTIYF